MVGERRGLVVDDLAALQSLDALILGNLEDVEGVAADGDGDGAGVGALRVEQVDPAVHAIGRVGEGQRVDASQHKVRCRYDVDLVFGGRHGVHVAGACGVHHASLARVGCVRRRAARGKQPLALLLGLPRIAV